MCSESDAYYYWRVQMREKEKKRAKERFVYQKVLIRTLHTSFLTQIYFCIQEIFKTNL